MENNDCNNSIFTFATFFDDLVPALKIDFLLRNLCKDIFFSMKTYQSEMIFFTNLTAFSEYLRIRNLLQIKQMLKRIELTQDNLFLFYFCLFVSNLNRLGFLLKDVIVSFVWLFQSFDGDDTFQLNRKILLYLLNLDFVVVVLCYVAVDRNQIWATAICYISWHDWVYVFLIKKHIQNTKKRKTKKNK